MKKLLFIYPEMLIGGSTTALLSLLNCLPSDKYEIDLQLFRNRGPLMDAIPAHVRLLPPAERYAGKKYRILKVVKFVCSGYAFKALFKGGRAVAVDFQAKHLSRKNPVVYDYAIGFLEGWADRYLAFGVHAKRKYAWLHSTFENITKKPAGELPWMEKVDRLVWVTDACRDDFKAAMPALADKAITVENITDSGIIRRRSLALNAEDAYYASFATAEALKIITVCRLTMATKGLDRIVACAQAMKSAGKKFLWYIIGDGEDRETLAEMIRTADVTDCLVLVGQRLNPYPFVAAADVMCMPSRYEGKPMTVTESQILGVPPVVTAYLSAHEQIRDGLDGLVVENEDDTVRSALTLCMEHPDRLAAMKRHLQTHEYGNKEYIKKVEEWLFDAY